ncbi:hypothetical protein [Nesterenkonia alba]|uniref:hypothetical protein n=1 Tax=Nesterenkonia alba TaxID=515814 RepID=UPI0003B4A0F9|nr:hypothetical protein [Nesterenkonia alba]
MSTYVDKQEDELFPHPDNLVATDDSTTRTFYSVNKLLRENHTFLSEVDTGIYLRSPARPLDHTPTTGTIGDMSFNRKSYKTHRPVYSGLQLLAGFEGGSEDRYDYHAVIGDNGEIVSEQCHQTREHKQGGYRACKRPHFFSERAAVIGGNRLREEFLSDGSWGGRQANATAPRMDAFKKYLAGEKLPVTICVYSVEYPFEATVCHERPYCQMRHFRTRDEATLLSLDLQIEDLENNVQTWFHIKQPLEMTPRERSRELKTLRAKRELVLERLRNTPRSELTSGEYTQAFGIPNKINRTTWNHEHKHVRRELSPEEKALVDEFKADMKRAGRNELIRGGPRLIPLKPEFKQWLQQREIKKQLEAASRAESEKYKVDKSRQEQQ